jgi:hypothetical protein
MAIISNKIKDVDGKKRRKYKDRQKNNIVKNKINKSQII